MLFALQLSRSVSMQMLGLVKGWKDVKGATLAGLSTPGIPVRLAETMH